MKPKPIMPDPIVLYRLGLRCLSDMAALVHLGRCGLGGSDRNAMARQLRMPYETLRAAVERLEYLRLVTAYGNSSGRGRAVRYAVTVTGWEALTPPACFPPFDGVQIPLGI